VNRLLKNHQLSGEIVDIIRNAKKCVYLVSPYFQPWPHLLKAFASASQAEKPVVVILRDEPKNVSMAELLHEDFGFSVFLVRNLHTKLYLNERQAIITSMNLYDYSKEMNYEVGYMFDSVPSAKQFLQEVIIGDILESQPESGWVGHLPDGFTVPWFERARANRSGLSGTPVPTNQSAGFCIRCSAPLELSTYRFLCPSCYSEWSQWGNPYYQERVCHMCGRPADVSKANPFCPACAKKTGWADSGF